MNEQKRSKWSGQLAFVLAAAASAIGLGNLWRFPYLAAQYGGGTFIAVYLILVVTLGFALMVTEIAVGRKTRQAPLTAYSKLNGKWGFIGFLATLIPVLIVPYYCVIGGWVIKYFVTYVHMVFTGATPMGAGAAASDRFFECFISSNFAPFGYGTIFILICASVIVMGVKNGIEKSNMVMMPVLFILALAISLYVVLLPGSGAGLKYYLVPSMDALAGADGGFSFARLAKTLLGAMGQMFYSLSLAMGIMITYGSYMRKEDSIERCVRRIEIFDTIIAIIAGLMIIPVVHMFAVKTGTPVKTAMNAGPGLMFITLPKVFATLGQAGAWLGMAFFGLVIFAALTSAISLYEACVASACDLLGIGRKAATFFMGALILFLSTFSALGYGAWGDIRILPGVLSADGLQFLDFFDFITNSLFMPVVALATCIGVGWIMKPKVIIEEVESHGTSFKAKRIYVFFVKYFAPVLMTLLLVSEVCRALNIGGWAI
ncbi:MAG: sodium-dependent transporter [Kiritimatiellae bacterium]|nr:sodium-dependent transporter [Kiritimatiellia bacterium]